MPQEKTEKKIVKINATTWLTAEDKVNKLLDRRPDVIAEVYINGGLAYRVENYEPDKKKH